MAKAVMTSHPEISMPQATKVSGQMTGGLFTDLRLDFDLARRLGVTVLGFLASVEAAGSMYAPSMRRVSRKILTVARANSKPSHKASLALANNTLDRFHTNESLAEPMPDNDDGCCARLHQT